MSVRASSITLLLLASIEIFQNYMNQQNCWERSYTWSGNLQQQQHLQTKANDQEDLLEMNMSDALDRICGTSSIESLPGKKINLQSTAPTMGWIFLSIVTKWVSEIVTISTSFLSHKYGIFYWFVSLYLIMFLSNLSKKSYNTKEQRTLFPRISYKI